MIIFSMSVFYHFLSSSFLSVLAIGKMTYVCTARRKNLARGQREKLDMLLGSIIVTHMHTLGTIHHEIIATFEWVYVSTLHNKDKTDTKQKQITDIAVLLCNTELTRIRKQQIHCCTSSSKQQFESGAYYTRACKHLLQRTASSSVQYQQ